MADDLPDAPWSDTSANLPDAPWSSPKRSLLEKATEPLTSIPSTYQRMVNESVAQMGQGVGQIGSGNPWEMAKGAGNVALGGLGYVTAPINAPIHTIVGKPVADVSGSPTAGTMAELGASLMLPVPKGLPRGSAALPEDAPFGVTLSAGEKANDMGMRQAEQAAIRGGDPHAQAWLAQRQAQVQAANDALVKGIDPYAQEVASTPQESGQLVSQGVQSAAANSKAAVNAAYTQARALPGEIDPSVFTEMPEGIKTELAASDEPVVVDHTTPFASKMIDYLNQRVGQLDIQNKAAPAGPGGDIVGVNLNGVDQMRKNLSAMRRDAFASSAPGQTNADARAARAVMDSFDSRIDDAVNSGAFTGDPSAVSAWNNARAANADYRSTFTAGKNDPVGRVVQKIIGDNVNDPLTPSKVMDQLVGSSRTNATALNIGVANRLKSILGEQSPEWIAAKQGLLRSLVESGEGETALGTGQVAQRLSKFLNGDMAGVIYTPQEQQTLRSYANLMRQVTMPASSYFPSAPGIAKVVSIVSNRIGAVIGGLVGHSLVPGMPLVGELGGMAAGSNVEKALAKAHQNVAKQLPLVSQQMQIWSRAQSMAQAAPNPMTQRAAAVATLNLQRALNPLGVKLGDVAQGPGTAYGNQNNIPGPPSQQKRGGAVAQQQRFAHGGKVSRFDPKSIGARKAKDGKHYLPDPRRPGKFLMVIPRA